MARKREVLRKIVALKRQSAEQHLRVIQMDLDRIEATLTELTVRLQGIDRAKAGFDALRLAEEHGHSRKLIADIRAAQANLIVKRESLHEAREALKRAFHSQEQISVSFQVD